jgi:putative transposase
VTQRNQPPANPARFNLFLLSRHRMTATDYRAERTHAFEAWHDVGGIQLTT